MENKCTTKFCRNTPPKKSNICYKCQKRKYREKYPIKAAYDNLKSNAKRRNKEFNITLEQFEQFCLETKYLVGCGRSKDSLHIDRKKEDAGYTIENIQTLTNSENVKKYLEWYWNGNKMKFTTKTTKQEPISDCPF